MPQARPPKKAGRSKKNAAKTTILSPLAAVEMVWAATGEPSQDTKSDSKINAVRIRNELNVILQQTGNNNTQSGMTFIECEYLRGAKASIESAIRSLDIIYKGRELNFTEIGELRTEQMKYITNTLNFGTRIKDFISSLPSIVIGSAGGLTLGEYLAKRFADGSPLVIVLLTLATGGLGYLVYIIAIAIDRAAKRKLLISEDYNRNLYYEHYIDRCFYVLLDLYLDLETIHERVFGNKYFSQDKGAELIRRTLKGVKPTFCKYTHKHFRENKINPQLWSICETGNAETTKRCPRWEG